MHKEVLPEEENRPVSKEKLDLFTLVDHNVVDSFLSKLSVPTIEWVQDQDLVEWEMFGVKVLMVVKVLFV